MASTRSSRTVPLVITLLLSVALVVACCWVLGGDQADDAPEEEQSFESLDDELPFMGYEEQQVGGTEAATTTYRTDDDLPTVATDVMDRYRYGEACLVRGSGYLGLLARTWSCVIEGPGWVDLCVVQQEDKGCTVRVTRIVPGDRTEMHDT
ncbi:MAG: hypothetical protein J6S63_03580 [Atopobiaceae bacterium]|nr:hypothetical protein [Atopobiaceae bacterium]